MPDLQDLIDSGVIGGAALQRVMNRRPSGSEQWQSAIEDQRQREQWDALKPSAGEKIGTGIKNYIQGGVPEVLRGLGVRSPDWVNSANDFLHNPDVNAAIGMASPIKGAALPESIKSAATRIGGKIYTGPTHGHAFGAAEDELKEILPQHEWNSVISKITPEDEGFITSEGRFVTRSEAAAIAAKTKQIDKSSPHNYPSGGTLASESMNLKGE